MLRLFPIFHFSFFIFQFAFCNLLAILCAGGALAAALIHSAAEKPGLNSADWPTERVQMRDGPTYEGYIESQEEFWINLMAFSSLR